ncbi:hypothetical protein PVK06_034736 [Gossypium arboreum]|uniref:Uncharacterized protein n=1 Tax=Gossypium arboreum TaxID=29729 RepID=A0ABR0NEZ8_GOSAR|nr:hypothetical protein PVK06_034736 [Gossypium arboreum]
MPLEPRASWFSPKCVEAQQLTGHLGVKHCFGAGRESGTKLRQTLNTRYDLKITGVEVGQDSQEVCLEAATLERVRNSSLIERSCAEDERG